MSFGCLKIPARRCCGEIVMVLKKRYELYGPNMSPEQRAAFVAQDNPAILAGQRDGRGLLQTNIIEIQPIYNLAKAEKVIQGKNNAMIILGRDRPGSVSDGYGAGVNSHAGCIDLVAGLSGPLVRNFHAGLGHVKTNKSTVLDAARVYISQRTDIDKDFNCPEGRVGQSTGISGIAVKADAVRIIGRNSVKIIGGIDKYNSPGIGSDPGGVDIIGGGTAEGPTADEMQPLVLGNNLIEFLEYLHEWIWELHCNQIEQMWVDLAQETLDALHFHITAAGPSTPGSNAISKGLAALYLGKRLLDVRDFWNSFGTTSRYEQARVKYFDEIGDGYFLSTWNSTN